MNLLASGSEVKIFTLDGLVYHKNISEIHPMMNEKTFALMTSQKTPYVFYHFHADNHLFMIERLPKTSVHLDIVQSVIHGNYSLSII